MKALEFWTAINADNTLPLPPEIAAEVGSEEQVRVILLTGDGGDDQDWAHLTAEQFLKGYADGDATYDDLLTR